MFLRFAILSQHETRGIYFSRKFFGIILLAMSVKMMTENIAKLF